MQGIDDSKSVHHQRGKRMSDRDEGEVSRIRQEIIDSARTNMAIKDREHRIQAKKERQSEARRRAAAEPKNNARQSRIAPQPNPEMYQVSPFHFAMPPLMVKLIIANGLMWAVIMFRLGEQGGAIGALVATPVLIVWIFIQWIVVYLVSKFYWWLNGCLWLFITMGSVLVLIAVLSGRTDLSNFAR